MHVLVAARFKRTFDQQQKDEMERPTPILPDVPFSVPDFSIDVANQLGEGRRTSRDVSPTSLSPTAQTPPGNRARTPADLLFRPH